MSRYFHLIFCRISLTILFIVLLSASAGADIFIPDAELVNSWGVLRIGAGLVHNMGNEGSGVKIGILDSGINYNNPELSSNYAGGWDFVNNDNDPYDDFGHGTAVAGIIGAADNGTGVVGVAPQASLYAYKVLDNTGNGTFDNVIAALDRAISDGMNVVNMSFGSPIYSDPGLGLLDACNRALTAGIVLVASAGNYGTVNIAVDNVTFPARYLSVIATAGTTKTDARARYSSISYSSTGPDVELSAPSELIQTTGLFSPYTFVSGTSFASAHVAGAAALLIHDGILNVRQRLTSTAIDLGTPGFDWAFGYGLVNVYDAVNVVPAPSAVILALLGLAIAYKKCRSIN
jgi:subtilisin